jgi:hypothetical protein
MSEKKRFFILLFLLACAVVLVFAARGYIGPNFTNQL